MTGFPDLRRPVDIIDPSIRTPDNLDDALLTFLGQDSAERTRASTPKPRFFKARINPSALSKGFFSNLRKNHFLLPS